MIAGLVPPTCSEKKLVPNTQEVDLDSLGHILPLGDSTVQPVLYHNIPSFNSLSIDESKKNFIATVLPAILISKYQLEADRNRLKWLTQQIGWTDQDSSFYLELTKRFDTEQTDKLFSRMLTHPNSIVLAQAIVESGWGSSRFFQQANNLFGIWSYRSNEPRIPAKYARNGKTVFVRKYHDVSESITDYFETIGRSRAYRKFRAARKQTQEVSELLPYLRYYSEKGDAYVKQLRTIIRQNNLTQYDHYQLDPSFFIPL